MYLSSYRGWRVSLSNNRPVTGIWVGECHGVTVSAGTLELLKTIIDNRILDYPPEGV